MDSFQWWPRFHDAAYRPTVGEAFAMHWRANMMMLRSPRAMVAFLVVSLWPVVVLLAAWWLLGFLDENNPFLTQSSVGLVTAAATFGGFLLLQHVAFSQALVGSYAPFVRRALRERGTPVCVGCGQLLGSAAAGDGTEPTRCPECGEPVEATSRPRPAATGGSSG